MIAGSQSTVLAALTSGPPVTGSAAVFAASCSFVGRACWGRGQGAGGRGAAADVWELCLAVAGFKDGTFANKYVHLKL